MKIRAQLVSGGARVLVNNRAFDTTYPYDVWKSFPKALRRPFADTLAYFFTAHFGLEKPRRLFYEFPPPQALSLFVHGLFYSLPEAVLEIPEAKFTSRGLMKSLFNSGFQTYFHGHPHPTPMVKPSPLNHRAIIPFSFGKDSLLTYSVAKEIGLTPIPIFFVEPESILENINKEKLRVSFQKEFGETIIPLPIPLGKLRQGKGLLWGWDLLLTQYTLLLLPYLYSTKAGYFFWSNEQSTNETESDKEGFTINTTFEQTVGWTLNLNNLLRQFSSSTMLGSLIEPLHELAILSILHRRYAEIGKYQLSCFNDESISRHQRWCGRCYECARVYIFLLAIGIDPKRVGFVDDMLALSKKNLYYMFDAKELTRPLNILFQSWGERLIAFYMAYRRGVKGDLIELFKKQLLELVIKQKDELFTQYFTIHSTETIPNSLRTKVLRIYRAEMRRLKRELTQEKLAPIEKFS
ncbi:hypothetical protein HY031_00275 [Candidatus Gottesmanbacteria bacterium]|nr:hypothetical protein [Candidatus Gottesmanbacteria bacterium]